MKTAHRCFRFLTTAIAIVVGGFALADAQSLSVYNINTTGFPVITADYVAFDVGGNPYTGLTKDDFGVSEQAGAGPIVDLTSTVTHDCETTSVDPDATILIVLDRSHSMYDVIDNGKTRFQYAKDAIKAFVLKIKYRGETRVCLTTFSGNYEVKVPWTSDPFEIIDTLNKLEPTSSTNYELPFKQPGSNVFELLKQRPGHVPKYVFFLTDGHPNPSIGSPNASFVAERRFVDETVLKFQQQGARFFAVSIAVPITHWTLQEIARMTGGKSILTNEKDLIDLFVNLALETQQTTLCHISWISPFVCYSDAQSRAVTITLKKGSNPKYQTVYVTPANSVASVSVSDPVLYCGDPLPSTTSFANVTITANNGPLHVDSYTITPPTYFSVTDWNFPNSVGTFVPFDLQPGKTRTIRVQFRQGVPQTFRQAKLRLTGTTCPPEIDLVGGQGLVLLTYPNGGQLFSTCDTVTITWAGVLPSQPVALEYSEDDGGSWTNIVSNATGLKYKWLPPRPGSRYRIKVSVSPSPQVQWLRQLGGTGNENHTSLAVSSDDLFIYNTGYFNGPARFGTDIVPNTAGNVDGFLTEFDSDGLLTKFIHLKGAGTNDDRVIGVISDTLGNYYVAGFHSSPTATFGSFNLSLAGPDKQNMFIFKFKRDGGLDWVHYGEGDGLNACLAGVDSIGISYDAGGYPRVIVAGKFQRFIRVGQRSGGGNEQSNSYNNNTDRPYYAIYATDGSVQLYANATAPAVGWRYQSNKAVDRTGFTYETGTYSGPKTLQPPTTTIPNSGGTDVFVSKIGAIPSSNDISDGSFIVKSPEFSYTIPTAVMTAVAQGQSSPNSFTGILCNTGDFPVVISDTNMVGSLPGDFRLISNLIGTRIDPGKCLTLEFEFIPTGIGMRTATLTVLGACAATASLNLEGEGLAPCAYEEKVLVDLGKHPLGQTSRYTIACMIKNVGPVPLSGTLTYAGSSEVTVISGDGAFNLIPGACLNDVVVEVNPTSGGIKTLIFNFGLAVECNVPTSTVNVEVVEPKVSISSVDMGRIRVGNAAQDTIRIRNDAANPVTITSISSSNNATLHLAFNLPTIPPPITIPPNGTVNIPVQYIPQARGSHIDTVYAIVQGQADPLAGEARGFGYLPAIGPTGWSFQPWTVGLQSPEFGYVTIRNTDGDAALEIGSVNFAGPTAVFVMDKTGLNFPLSIPVGDSLRIPVRFTPQAPGKQCIDVHIEHDAKSGPDPIPPYAVSTVSVCGVGIEASDIPPVAMGNVLTCAAKTAAVRISNPNNTQSLTCEIPLITGDIGMFSTSHATRFTIPANQFVDVSIVYSPTAVGPHAVTYDYPNDQGLSLKINASGNGVQTTATFTFGNMVTSLVGEPASTPVNVAVGALDTVQVRQVTLTFSFDPQYLSFLDFAQPMQAGWSFDKDVNTPGTLIVTGTSQTGATLTNGAFVTPRFSVYITADSTLPISFTSMVEPDCIVGSGDASNVSLQLVCFAAGRLVTIGGSQFTIAHPSPNPASERAEVLYSTGIDLSTTFELIDAMGNTVKTITTPVLKSGTYQLQLDLSELGNGSYILRMTSGPYSESRRISIVK